MSRDNLRPIEKYAITIRITGSRLNKRQAHDRGDELHQIEVDLAGIQCKFDQSSMTDHCEYSVRQEVQKGKTYSITLCAENEFGKTCQSSGSITTSEVAPTAAQVGSGLPVGAIVGIVICILGVVLFFSLLLIFFAVLKRRNERKEIQSSHDDSDSER